MKWISVKDRLPEDTRDVLCCDCCGDMGVMYLNTHGWYLANIDGAGELDMVPVHWMELPEPPKGE